jgi:hypothetical protein
LSLTSESKIFDQRMQYSSDARSRPAQCLVTRDEAWLDSVVVVGRRSSFRGSRYFVNHGDACAYGAYGVAAGTAGRAIIFFNRPQVRGYAATRAGCGNTITGSDVNRCFGGATDWVIYR